MSRKFYCQQCGDWREGDGDTLCGDCRLRGRLIWALSIMVVACITALGLALLL